jgi:hypothetical protein
MSGPGEAPLPDRGAFAGSMRDERLETRFNVYRVEAEKIVEIDITRSKPVGGRRVPRLAAVPACGGTSLTGSAAGLVDIPWVSSGSLLVGSPAAGSPDGGLVADPVSSHAGGQERGGGPLRPEADPKVAGHS